MPIVVISSDAVAEAHEAERGDEQDGSQTQEDDVHDSPQPFLAAARPDPAITTSASVRARCHIYRMRSKERLHLGRPGLKET
jgi:hypothetical protein